jgi:hypothetical protein
VYRDSSDLERGHFTKGREGDSEKESEKRRRGRNFIIIYFKSVKIITDYGFSNAHTVVRFEVLSAVRLTISSGL